jgi:hypothetical protein
MVLGNVGIGTATADIYFDQLELWRVGEPTGEVVDVTLRVDYIAHSGGTGYTSSADIYLDSVTLL